MDNLKRLKICLLLHFYQPWWQPPWMIRKIADECYRPILRLIEEFDGFCFTANINLVLLEHLEKYCPDVVDGFKKAVESGRLELVGSTAQHPIMPLVPEFVQRANIEEDLSKKETHFRLKHNCKGFFLPEMAFSTNDMGLLKSYGYEWTVIDDVPVAAACGKEAIPFNRITNYNGFRIFMRSNYWSNMISDGKFSFADIKSMMECQLPGWTGNAPAYIVIAMDAETFGHHHKHLIETFLAPMLREWSGSKLVPIESLIQDFPDIGILNLPDCSWSTASDDIKRGNPYPLWSGKVSVNRYRLWRLVNTALKYFEQAREDCLKMTSSCHWWWISRSGWEPEFMQKGATLAMEVIRKHGTPDELNAVQNDYYELMQLIKVFVHND